MLSKCVLWVYVLIDSVYWFNFHAYLFKIIFYIYFWERETEWEQGRGREREQGRHRIWRRLQALSHQHRAWHRGRTYKLRDHDLSRSWMLNRLSHPGAPMGLNGTSWDDLGDTLICKYAKFWWTSLTGKRWWSKGPRRSLRTRENYPQQVPVERPTHQGTDELQEDVKYITRWPINRLVGLVAILSHSRKL